MASCANGRIHWQNSASCAAIGTVASDVALPIRGVCGEFELDYVGQLFWGNAVSGDCMPDVARPGFKYAVTR